MDAPLIAGIACFVAGLWLFYRSHADLGTNWSITLQVRENHRLVVDGVLVTFGILQPNIRLHLTALRGIVWIPAAPTCCAIGAAGADAQRRR